MKKFIFTTIVALIATTAAFAQDYKIAKSSGKLIINLPGVSVEGYNGN